MCIADEAVQHHQPKKTLQRSTRKKFPHFVLFVKPFFVKKRYLCKKQSHSTADWTRKFKVNSHQTDGMQTPESASHAYQSVNKTTTTTTCNKAKICFNIFED